MHGRPETVLVVIDAQRAFVDPAGSLARTFGPAELQPGVAALGRLRGFLAGRDATAQTIFVRSEYRPGQFTGGDLQHVMAHVCVPGHGIDCEWAAGIEVRPRDVVVTKHHADATTAGPFLTAIDHALDEGATRIEMVGFQFATCVAASATSTVALVRARAVRVAIIESMTGSRASSHLPGASGLSRIDVTRQQLEAAGVELVTTLDWRP